MASQTKGMVMMDLAQYQKIKSELKADHKKARDEHNAWEVKACRRALDALNEIKKVQGF